MCTPDASHAKEEVYDCSFTKSSPCILTYSYAALLLARGIHTRLMRGVKEGASRSFNHEEIHSFTHENIHSFINLCTQTPRARFAKFTRVMIGDRVLLLTTTASIKRMLNNSKEIQDTDI